MALFPEPREDLLSEATAMPERGELTVPGESAAVFVGFRRDGAASIYLGEDPVLHFDTHGRLRRMYFSSEQIVAQRGRLVGYLRSPSTSPPQARRMTAHLRPLSADQQRQMLSAVEPRLQRVLRTVADGTARWTGSTVPTDQLRQRLASLAAATADGIRLAQRPHAQ